MPSKATPCQLNPRFSIRFVKQVCAAALIDAFFRLGQRIQTGVHAAPPLTASGKVPLALIKASAQQTVALT